jgi:hypothetical protein
MRRRRCKTACLSIDDQNEKGVSGLQRGDRPAEAGNCCDAGKQAPNRHARRSTAAEVGGLAEKRGTLGHTLAANGSAGCQCRRSLRENGIAESALSASA